MAKIQRKKKVPSYKRFLNEWYKGIMNGISYIIPLIVAAGVLMGILNLIFGYDFTHDASNESVYLLYQLTGQMMGLMVPLFSAYIAYGIVGKPGIIPGLAGGLVMQGGNFGDISIASAGFLGALFTGGLAALVVIGIKKIKVHKYFESVQSVIVIPLVGTLLVGAAALFIIAPPIGALNEGLTNFLTSLDSTSLFLVGAILGVMAAADMGGPINKAAYIFAIGMWAEGDFTYYAAFTLAKCIPGIIVGVSVLYTSKVYKNLDVYTEEEKELSVAAVIMGLFGITEGVIPYAAKDPLRIIPTAMVGCALGSGLVLSSGIEIATGAGGSFLMLPLISEPFKFLLYSVISVLISAVLLTYLKVKKAKSYE